MMSSEQRFGILILVLMNFAVKCFGTQHEEAPLKWFEHRQSHDSVTKRPFIQGFDRPPGPGPHGYEIQFIGYTRYVTPDEEQKRNFCSSYFCTNDAFYIFTKSSQYIGQEACNDFKNFTVDHVVQVDVPDDRDPYRGFESIVKNLYMERLRKVAATSRVIKNQKNETNRIVRVVRNHFAKCLKSPLVLRHLQAHQDTVEYLESFGGSPHLYKHRNFNKQLFNPSNEEDYGRLAIQTRNLRFDFDAMDEEWDDKKFNVSRLFETETWFVLRLFLDMEVKRCVNDHLCLSMAEYSWEYREDEEYDFQVFKQLLDDLEDFYLGLRPFLKLLDEKYFRPGVGRRRQYLKILDQLKERQEESWPRIMRIKDLQALMPKGFEVSWLQMINNELMESSKVTEDEEILIEGGIELLQAFVRNILDTEKKILADTFVLTFLYEYRFLIILRFHNKHILKDYGAKKGWQRWLTCLLQNSIDEYMRPAQVVMYEEQREIWDRTLGDVDRNLADERVDIVGNCEKLVYEAVDEFKRRFIKMSDLPPDVALDVLTKLKQLRVVVSLKREIFPLEMLEEFYKELPLKGDENFMISAWEMRKNHRRILNEPQQSWRRQIDRMVYAQENEFVTYNIEDGNILYIPPNKLVYPWYHPSRPRFFNIATQYAEVLARLYRGVEKYLKERYNIAWTASCCQDNLQIAYEVYSKWLDHNTELQVGANYLTNRQLYWVAVALTRYGKYHRTVPAHWNARGRLQHEYLHVLYKNFKGFQEAFNCSLSEKEKAEYEEFLGKWRTVNG